MLKSCSRMDIEIVLFCLVVIAALWVMAVERVNSERREAQDHAFRESSNLAIALEEHTSRTIKGVDQVLLFVRHEYERDGPKLNIRKLLNSGTIDDGILNFLGVTDEFGQVRIGSSGDFHSVNAADRAYFTFHKTEDLQNAFIGPPIVGRISGKWSIHMSRRLNKPDGSFNGVVFAAVDPTYFTNFYRQADLGEQGLVMLLGADGIARARRVGQTLTFGQDMHSSTLVAELVGRSTGSFISNGRLDSVRRFLSYRTLQHYPLVVAVATSETEQLAAVREREHLYYLTAALGSAVAAAFAISMVVGLSRERRDKARLAINEARFHGIFDQASAGIALSSLDGRFLQVNQALCAGTGFDRDTLLTMTLAQIMDPEEFASTMVDLTGLQAGEIRSSVREVRYRRPDGSTIWSNRGLSLVRDVSGIPQYFILVLQDITERKLLQERVLHQTQFDGLTELPNRTLFHDRLMQALNQANRRSWIVALLFIDLDRFKIVNDTLGSAFGDQLLKQVAQKLKQSVRLEDTVARLGGDEFAIILSDLGEPQVAASIARKIIAALALPVQLDEHEVYISASIGIATFPHDGSDADSLLKNANSAMYDAKESGKNDYRFCAAAMNEKALEKMALENSLRRALERHELVLYFQPKTSIASGEITGCEALLRWNRAGHGLVAPAAFVPLMEESGMIVAVGEWVITAACAQVRAWQQAGLTPVAIAVNVSAKQFQHRDICATVDRALHESTIAAKFIEIEITESTAMRDAEKAIITLRGLKALGVRISIDDFGTGYSSLTYLKRFPVDALKLDQSFVSGLPDNAEDASIARAVVSMAHSLNLKVIAEGVETSAQRAFLAAEGCDEMQGYLFSQPLPEPEFTRLLRHLDGPPVSLQGGQPERTPIAVVPADVRPAS